MYKDSIKVGITLSGGGARGIGHIGILQALEENGVIPDIILGTSAGAIVGAFYAAGYSPYKIKELAKQSSLIKVFKLVIPRRGLSRQDYLLRHLLKYLPENSFDALEKELYVGVTNLNLGKHEIWNHGDLHRLVLASSSVPGIFTPIEIEGAFYVDGGVMNNMPAAPIRSKCDFLIGSNVVAKADKSSGELNGLKSILARTFEISLWYRSHINYDFCDQILEPPGLNRYNIFNFSKAGQIYDFGYQHAIEKMPLMIESLENILVDTT